MLEDPRVGLARSHPRRGDDHVDQVRDADLGDGFVEVPVPVGADREAQTAASQFRQNVRRFFVRLHDPRGVPGAHLLDDHLVFARVYVGLREHRQQALLLPRDVVVAALGMLVVLDTVEAVVPPAFADLVRQLVAVLGEHDVD